MRLKITLRDQNSHFKKYTGKNEPKLKVHRPKTNILKIQWTKWVKTKYNQTSILT